MADSDNDPVKHPSHYTSHPSGVEVIEIVKHENFCVGSAIKYLLRADKKGDPIENLRKARQMIDFEIERREGEVARREGEVTMTVPESSEADLLKAIQDRLEPGALVK